MSSYYSPPPQAVDGDIAYAKDINDVNNEADTGFSLVEADIIAQEATVAAWAALAEKWAQEAEDVEVAPGEYSAFHYSEKTSADRTQISSWYSDIDGWHVDIGGADRTGNTSGWRYDSQQAQIASAASEAKAEDWADEAEDVPVETGPDRFSAYHWSQKAHSGFEEAITLREKQEFVATSGQTLFTIATSYDNVSVDVSLNGRELFEGESEYSYNSGTKVLTLQTGATVGDRVVVRVSNRDALPPIIDDAISDAEDARDLAQEWAENPEDTAITGYPGQYSSLHHSAKSEDHAATSAGSATLSSQWADEAEDTPVTTGPDRFSAFHWAQKAGLTNLQAIDNILQNSANITDVFYYDTASDSDGGAWTDKLRKISWYKETLNTATRGATRAFPKRVLIVSTTSDVTIYDATKVDTPMWMVFNAVTGGILNTTPAITSVSMIQGELSIGTTNTRGLISHNFLKDEYWAHDDAGIKLQDGGIVDRNEAIFNTTVTGTPIIDSTIIDVAMTVLSGASVDPITGIEVPTIGVATDGGISVIDGSAGVDTVIDITHSAGSTYSFAIDIAFNSDRLLLAMDADTAPRSVVVFDAVPSSDTTTATKDAEYRSSAAPSGGTDLNYLGGVSDISLTSNKAIASEVGLTLLDEDTTTPSLGSVTYITQDYNTGPLWGDSRIATLMDIVAGTVGTDVTELVIDGDFPDATNWDEGTGWTIGSGVASSDGSSGELRQLSLSSVEGELYLVEGVVANRTTGTLIAALESGGGSLSITANGAFSGVIAAGSGSSLGLRFISSSGFDGDVDDVSVKRSQNLVKNNTFISDTEWTKGTGWTIGSGVASCDGTQTGSTNIEQVFDASIGTIVLVKYTVSSYTAGQLRPIINSGQFGTYVSSAGTYKEIFTVTGSGKIFLQGDIDFIGSIDDIEIYELDVEDRSVKQNPLRVVGQLTKTAVATGAEAVSWGGFTNVNHVRQPYTSDLDYGTGDCHFRVAFKTSALGSNRYLFDRATPVTGGSGVYRLNLTAGDLLTFQATALTTLTSTTSIVADALYIVDVVREDSTNTVSLYLNGKLEDSNTTGTGTWTNVTAELHLGILHDLTGAATDTEILHFSSSATNVSAAKIEKSYHTLRGMLQAGVAISLQDSTDVVQAVAYDEDTNEVHAGTDAGITVFEDGVVTDTLKSTEDIVAISAKKRSIVVATDAQASFSEPEINVRNIGR